MCLLLYLATSGDQPLRQSPDLSVEDIEPARAAVCQWFSLPTIRYIGSHSGCSCGFPSVSADEPVEYFEGMPLGKEEDRPSDLRSVRALLDLIAQHLRTSGEVQLYPVWDGEEGLSPKGAIDRDVTTLEPETFFLNERFMLRIYRQPS
jgi:hypothetical protein